MLFRSERNAISVDRQPDDEVIDDVELGVGDRQSKSEPGRQEALPVHDGFKDRIFISERFRFGETFYKAAKAGVFVVFIYPRDSAGGYES